MRLSLEAQLLMLKPKIFTKKSRPESDTERKQREEEWKEHIESIL